MEDRNETPHQSTEERLKQFECKICLEVASEPVVTLCGHLFCWSCVYKWAAHKEMKQVPCPMCKGEIDVYKLIPLYTSTEAHKKRTENLPNRPQGSRNPEPEQANRGFFGNLFGNGNNGGDGGFNFTFMGFPGFGFQFNLGGANPQRGIQQWFAMGFMFVMIMFSFFASFLPNLFGVSYESEYYSSRTSRQSSTNYHQQSRSSNQQRSTGTYRPRTPIVQSQPALADELIWWGYGLVVTAFMLYTAARIIRTRAPTAPN